MAFLRNEFDAVIIGAGGAGMRASLQLANSGLKVALLSKVFPTRLQRRWATLMRMIGAGICTIP